MIQGMQICAVTFREAATRISKCCHRYVKSVCGRFLRCVAQRAPHEPGHLFGSHVVFPRRGIRQPSGTGAIVSRGACRHGTRPSGQGRLIATSSSPISRSALHNTPVAQLQRWSICIALRLVSCALLQRSRHGAMDAQTCSAFTRHS